MFVRFICALACCLVSASPRLVFILTCSARAMETRSCDRSSSSRRWILLVNALMDSRDSCHTQASTQAREKRHNRSLHIGTQEHGHRKGHASVRCYCCWCCCCCSLNEGRWIWSACPAVPCVAEQSEEKGREKERSRERGRERERSREREVKRRKGQGRGHLAVMQNSLFHRYTDTHRHTDAPLQVRPAPPPQTGRSEVPGGRCPHTCSGGFGKRREADGGGGSCAAAAPQQRPGALAAQPS